MKKYNQSYINLNNFCGEWQGEADGYFGRKRWGGTSITGVPTELLSTTYSENIGFTSSDDTAYMRISQDRKK